MITQQVSFGIRVAPLDRAAIWLPGAIILTVLLVSPYREWPLLYASFCVAAITAFWFDPIIGPLYAFFRSHHFFASIALGAWLILKLGGEPLLACRRSLIVFMLVGVVLIPCLCTLGNYLLGLPPLDSGESDFWSNFMILSLSISIGFLVGTPLAVLTFRNWHNPSTRVNLGKTGEFLLLTLVLGLANYIVFSTPLSAELVISPLAPLLISLWAAMRLGVVGVSWCLIMIAYQACWGAIHGYGPFVGAAPTESVLQLHLYLVAFALPLFFLSASVDERQRAFQALEHEVEAKQLAENRFRTVVEFAPVAIVMVDAQAKICLFNAHAEQTFGYDRTEVRRQSLEVLMPDSQQLLMSAQQDDSFSHGEESRCFRLNAIRRDGTEFPVEVAQTRLINQEGRFVLLAVDDVTDRNRLVAFRNELAQTSRLVTLGSMATSISHEINQPLGAILSNSEAAELILESPRPSLDLLRKIISDIRRDDLRASEVVKRMRSFLRQGKMEIKPLDMGQVIEEVVDFVRVDTRSNQVKINLKINPHLPRVLANRIHLQQVLVNLMINGLESMTAVHHQQVLTITAETSSDHFVEIAVADNGMGIAPEQLDKLFSQFHTTKPNGLGLGLIISKTLIEGQGGQISAENMAAGGAKFRIRLPVAETVQEQPSSLVSV